VRHFLHAPLYPDQLSVRSFYRPSLLETRPQQGSVVNSLRIWESEPLRSASSLLGFIICLCVWDPGGRFVAGPNCGPHCLQDPVWFVAPDSFLGRHPIAVDYHGGPVVMRFMAAAFRRGRGGCGCGGNGPDHFVGSPPRWISTSLRLATLAESLLCIGGRTERILTS
jgi:hypothetical protein